MTDTSKPKVIRIEVKPEVWERAPIPESGPIRYFYDWEKWPESWLWVDTPPDRIVVPSYRIRAEYLHEYATSEWVEVNVIRDWKTGTIYSGGYWLITTEWRWLDTPTPPKDKSVETE